MDSNDGISSYSSDYSDSIDMNSSDTSSLAVPNSELSSYNEETDSDDDVSPIKPYQFEPTTELFDCSSEEPCESEDEASENDERLTNTDW